MKLGFSGEILIVHLDGMCFPEVGEVDGTWHKAATLKSSHNLPTHKMTHTDLSRILKRPESQRDLRAPCRKDSA